MNVLSFLLGLVVVATPLDDLLAAAASEPAAEAQAAENNVFLLRVRSAPVMPRQDKRTGWPAQVATLSATSPANPFTERQLADATAQPVRPPLLYVLMSLQR
jgi:hypothetical protein